MGHFSGGLHLNYNKYLSEDKPISSISLPDEVIIPLLQNIGKPCEPVVVVGDRVSAGQLIGDSNEFISAAVHSSVAGTVKSVEARPYYTGENIGSYIREGSLKGDRRGNRFISYSLKSGKEIKSINIAVDKEENDEFSMVRDPDEVSGKEVLTAIKNAGIVGMGGAAFPTAVKLSPPKDKPVHTIIINGCECEPFLTCDYRLMIEQTDALIIGAKLLLKASGASNCVFAIEDNKNEAYVKIKERLNKMAGESEYKFRAVELPSIYPQGSEKHLIKSVLNLEVPMRGLPFDVGVIVQNISTTFAVYEAVVFNKPLIERVVTVTGPNIKRPANLIVKLGTPVEHLINECGGIIQKPFKVVLGGPMTGFTQVDNHAPIVKGNNGVVILNESISKVESDKKYYPCMRCGKCVVSCPMRLYPNYLGIYTERERLEKAKEWDVMDCIECGICSYICPSHRPNSYMIKKGKNELLAK